MQFLIERPNRNFRVFKRRESRSVRLKGKIKVFKNSVKCAICVLTVELKKRAARNLQKRAEKKTVY